MCPACDLCLVHAHVLILAACFYFHYWPLKQPCAGCLDVFRDRLGSENIPIMPSQVSPKPLASFSSYFEAQKWTSYLSLSELSKFIQL